jgi:hypothetical protein
VGTKFTPEGVESEGDVKAVTSIGDARLILIAGEMQGADALTRVAPTVALLRVDIWLTAQSKTRNEIRIAVAPSAMDQVVAALRREFATEMADGKLCYISAWMQALRSSRSSVRTCKIYPRFAIEQPLR